MPRSTPPPHRTPLPTTVLILLLLSTTATHHATAAAAVQRFRPLTLRLRQYPLRRPLPARQTHIFTLPRQCRGTPCALRAKAQLEENGCTHTTILDGLQMLRAHCGRDANMNALRTSPRFTTIQLDHDIALAGANQSLSTLSVVPPPDAADSAEALPSTDVFESIELGGSLSPSIAARNALIDEHRRAPFRSTCYPRAGAGTRIFIIDTGCRTTHEQLAGRVRAYPAPGSPYASGDDDHGHGTHVAATIVGRDFGVARGARVECIKALSSQNAGSSADVVAAIDHVIALKTKHRHERHRTPHPPEAFLMSISLGVRAPASYSALDRAVSRAAAAGITPIVAAGNAAGDACTFTPARARGAITVGALAGGGLASFSNRGRCVALAAPGVAVRSAYHAADDAYARSSGTSMAAPHVTGVAALVLGEEPGLRPGEVLREMVEAAGGPVGGVPVSRARQECTGVGGGVRGQWGVRVWRAVRRAAGVVG